MRKLYAGRQVTGWDQLASKISDRTWIQSVQGAVATWSVISMRDFLTILDPIV
jgi:hypothetical protein